MLQSNTSKQAKDGLAIYRLSHSLPAALSALITTSFSLPSHL